MFLATAIFTGLLQLSGFLGADRVVVGEVLTVTAEWRVLPNGSEAIASRTDLAVTEVLAGDPATHLSLDLLGGEMHGIRFADSAETPLAVGDRAVFGLVDRGGRWRPMDGNASILLLGTDLSDRLLDILRETLAGAP